MNKKLNDNMLDRIPVAFYGRFSSDNQREESIDAQLRAAREFAKANGLLIIREYVDRAKSGKTANRPDFLKMIDDSKKQEFKYVLVHKLDRFSRNKYDSAIYKKKLADRGVKVISVVERLDDSPESVMMESVIEGFAQYYVANLKREVMKGLKENAYQCKHTGGKPPIGYDLDSEKKLVINEEEANAVKMIFNMYILGAGYSEIIRSLAEKGIRSKQGKTFAKNSIYGIITNEKYTGVYIFNKRASENSQSKRNNHLFKDNDEIIRIEGGVPQIIDKETFKEAQAVIKQRKHSKARNSAVSNYLLSGLVRCGECGAALTGNRRKSGKGFLFESYRCSGKSRKFTDCSNSEIKKTALEDYVLFELENNVLNPQNIGTLVGEINQNLKDLNRQNVSEVKPLRTKIVSIENKLRNIVTAIENGIEDDMMYVRMSELNTEKGECLSRLAQLDIKEVLPLVHDGDVKKLFSQFREDLYKQNLQITKRIFSEFIDNITVYNDHIEITFNVVFSLELRFKNIHHLKKKVNRNVL